MAEASVQEVLQTRFGLAHRLSSPNETRLGPLWRFSGTALKPCLHGFDVSHFSSHGGLGISLQGPCVVTALPLRVSIVKT